MDNNHVSSIAMNAKKATIQMGSVASKQKDDALKAIADNLDQHRHSVLDANAQDVSHGKRNGLSDALLERLSLENKIEGIIQDIHQVINLPDPTGERFDEKKLPNGLSLTKYRTPIGVLGVIYESRPNVTIDISVLTIKSGNCAILRGGSETLNTNIVLVELIQRALSIAKLPSMAIQLIGTTDRSHVNQLLQLYQYVDLIIPRGSASLHKFCRENSKIPVITGGIGICHLFVDESADLERSLQVILNAKVQRPTVCNALDTLLVHAAVAPTFIPEVIRLLGAYHVSFRLDQKAWNLGIHEFSKPATDDNWDTEWLSLVLGIKIVENIQEAIDHIHLHSTGHSDGILTENKKNGEIFIKAIDSAVVYVNASTRFTDGGQFGFGAEVAISTQKLHARGPMGLHELTSYKWVVEGKYQVRT